MKNFRTKIGFTALILMLAFSCKSSAEKYVFEYNLPQGETLKMVALIESKTTMQAMGQEMKTEFNLNTTSSYTVKTANTDNYIVDMTYDAIKMDIHAMDTSMSFDSNTDSTKASEQDFGPVFKAMTNIPVEFEITKSGKVESVKGYEKITEAINDATSELNEAVKGPMLQEFSKQFSSNAMKELFEQSTMYFPTNSVAVGETWKMETKSTANIPLDINMDMKLISIQDNVAVIEGTGNISTPAEGITQNTGGVEVKVSLKGTQTAKIEIDTKTGWVISATTEQNLTGDTEFMGMKIPMIAVNTIKVTN